MPDGELQTHRITSNVTQGYVGTNAKAMGQIRGDGGDYSWQSKHDRYAGSTAWTVAPYGPGTSTRAQAGRNLIGRMPDSPAYSPEGYGGPPIPGFSGGMLPVSASYEFLPQNTPVYLPSQIGQPSNQQPAVSPVQQLAPLYKNDKPEGPMDVGSSVKLKFFSSPEGMLYNGMVGDIVSVRMEKGFNSLPEPVYDVRCPWRDPRTVKKEALDDKDHGHVLHSAFTADKAHDNRRLLSNRPVDLPSMGGFSGQPMEDCPYILLTAIPREKLEPLQEWKESGPPPAAPVHVQPMQYQNQSSLMPLHNQLPTQYLSNVPVSQY